LEAAIAKAPVQGHHNDAVHVKAVHNHHDLARLLLVGHYDFTRLSIVLDTIGWRR